MIEFIESTHTYLVDGMVVPSVTTILSATVFKGKYEGIPDFVLQQAAEFGSAVHKAIETKEYGDLNDLQLGCIVDYMDLIKKHDIKELEHETMLHYGYDYAGTMDLLIEYQGKKALADIKTTSKLDLEYLSWQLSMYAFARGFKGRLFAFWLPKYRKYGVADFIEIKRKSDEEIEWLIKKYKEITKDE